MIKTGCCYQVDAQDNLIFIGGAWSAFARENEGKELLNNPPLGRSIWEFIHGLSTRNIYHVLMKQVRETGRTACFPFRCDSPDLLRYMEMELSLEEDKAILFKTTLTRDVKRHETLELTGRSHTRTAIVQMCAWCDRVQVGAEWLSLEDAIWALGLFDAHEAPPISHGMCPDCVGQIHQNLPEVECV